MKPSPHCCALMYHGAFHRSYPCKNPGKIQEGGKFYCGIHDPAKKRATQEGRKVRIDAAMKKRRAEIRAPILVKVLKDIRERCPGVHTTDQETGKTFADSIDEALSDLA